VGFIFFYSSHIDIILQCDMDRFVEDGSLDDNVESFLSHDDTDMRDTVNRCIDVGKGEVLLYIVNIGRLSFSLTICSFSF
jgi:hypothetical protein